MLRGLLRPCLEKAVFNNKGITIKFDLYLRSAYLKALGGIVYRDTVGRDSRWLLIRSIAYEIFSNAVCYIKC